MEVRNGSETQYGIVSINLMLGNFHTQGSFLGSMGYVMKNSGLAQAFATVYGEEPVKTILSGKSYERAMRAHCSWPRNFSHEEDVVGASR